MHKELELWKFIATRLTRGENVMLLVVAQSSGSSPGRQGYKMVVGSDGVLCGSIGGGVMEVSLVEQSRVFLRDGEARGRGDAEIKEQVHQRNSPNASGMICSGKQTVIFKLVTREDYGTVGSIIDGLESRRGDLLTISPTEFKISSSTTPSAEAAATPPIQEGSLRTPPEDRSGTNPKSKIQNPKSSDFTYTEHLGFANELYIIGGGHCSLALSEMMSKLDFHISLFDDRPELNTIEKNKFAKNVIILDRYESISEFVPAGECTYVVVMTLGYKSDAQVIRALIDKEFKYFGVLGSSAKMSSMFKELIKEGLPVERLDRIRTPVGIQINSRTPEEIAVSIAAEIISVKNSA